MLSLTRSQQAVRTACVFLSLLAATPVSAQDRMPPDVLQRMDRLEQELNTLNAAIYRDGKKPDLTAAASSNNGANSNQINDIYSRLDSMERQLREMTGQLEEANFKAQQAQDKADKLQSQLDMRLQALESKQATGAAPAAPTSTGGDAAQIAPSTGTAGAADAITPPAPEAPNNLAASDSSDLDGAANPDNAPTVKPLGEITQSGGASSQDAANMYETAYSQLKQGNAAQAKTQFANFMKAYPDHPLAANASYWYADSYFTDGDYTNAARLFAESYQKYPKGPKAADSVLKLGLSLAKGDKPQDACIALKQLDRSYKDADQELLARAKEEQTKLGCK